MNRAHEARPLVSYDLVPPEPDEVLQTASAGSLMMANMALIKRPYIAAMAGISSLAALAALMIDFQFYATVTITGNSSADFFANFYIFLNAAALILQLFLAPMLQRRLGVGGVLMLLPFSLLGGAGVATWWTAVQTKAILRVTEGGVKAALHRSTWEQTFLRISREKRAIAKVLVDGLSARMSEGIGSTVLYVWLLLGAVPTALDDLHWITWLLLVCLLGWLAITRYLQTLGCSTTQATDPVVRLPDT